MLLKESSEGLAGDLTALVSVEYLWLALAQGFFKSIHTEVCLQSVGHAPG